MECSNIENVIICICLKKHKYKIANYKFGSNNCHLEIWVRIKSDRLKPRYDYTKKPLNLYLHIRKIPKLAAPSCLH